MDNKGKITIDKKKLDCIRRFLVEEVFENPNVMFSDQVRGCEYDTPDLATIIACLYEYLHILIEGEEYAYFFHWANKIGSGVEEGDFDALINDRMERGYYEREED